MFEEIYRVIEEGRKNIGFTNLSGRDEHYLDEGFNIALQAVGALEEYYIKEANYEFLELAVESVKDGLEYEEVIEIVDQVYSDDEE